jgi:hypothetical protein
MYRSLSDRGSFTEYVYVLVVTDSNYLSGICSHFNLPDLLLGHRMCLNYHRGTRFPPSSTQGPVYGLHLPRNRMGLGR